MAGERRRVVTAGLLVQIGPQNDDADGENTLGVGYTSSKRVGNAVQRNRAKRRMRALAREILPDYDFGGRNVVLIARAETVDRPFALLRKDLHRALKRLHIQRRA